MNGMTRVVSLAIGDNRLYFDGVNARVIPNVTASGIGRATLAALEQGDGLRRYCEYLEAHGYPGNAYKHAKARRSAHMREQWAITAYHEYVTDDLDLLSHMMELDEEEATV